MTQARIFIACFSYFSYFSVLFRKWRCIAFYSLFTINVYDMIHVERGLVFRGSFRLAADSGSERAPDRVASRLS